jgi:hypothetical protein
VRNLRPSNVGEPSTSFLLLQLPAVPPAVSEHPSGHPASVYLGEPVLHEAVVGFMATALFGPERQDYWRRRLADSGREEEAAPAHARLEQLRAEIADLERRIERQVANLEAEDATPSLRRRVGARIAELEEALEERRQQANALAAQSADAPPTVADLTTALDRLPLLAERLQDLPQPELRALFDSLQLQIAFRPKTRTIDVEVTLVADEQPDRDDEMSQVWSVPPAGIEPATRGLGNRCSHHRATRTRTTARDKCFRPAPPHPRRWRRPHPRGGCRRRRGLPDRPRA